MGWWSEDIMGGDTPLDIQGCIFDFVIGNDDEEWIDPESFDLEKLLKDMKDSDWSFFLKGNDRNIFFQVLGVLLMMNAVPIPDHLKQEMFDAANNDEWAKDSEERQEVMDGFIQALELYDGSKPIIIKSKGLFEVMAERMGAIEPEKTDLDVDDLMFIHDALNNYFLEAISK